MLCIDWGASSIAAGITDDRNPQHVLALPLGDVFRNASGLGGRMQAVREGAVLLDEDMPDLIPSRLSLASRRNFRAALNRFSYLDLRAGGDTQAAVDRRIMALDRHYDIALPVPTSMAAQDDTHAELTLPSLKMLLAESRDRVPLSEAVATRGSDGRIIRAAEIVIPHLMLDCLDEVLRILPDRERQIAGGARPQARRRTRTRNRRRRPAPRAHASMRPRPPFDRTLSRWLSHACAP